MVDPIRSTSFETGDVLGSTEPRLWTRPLRELTPETSYGFDVIDFARDVLGQPLDPWESWAVIHTGELLPDGRPRFRTVLILVARQNGKTFLLKVLALFWLFVECQPLVLGTSTNRDTAKEAWQGSVAMAQECAYLAARIPSRGGVREANGEECLSTIDGSRYKIAASNRQGGRGLTINRLVIDELREHRSFIAWDAATYATNAVWDSQTFAISNQGDEEAVVLDSLRTPALEFIETGEGDPGLGLFEWSSAAGADPTDPEALAMANPNLGRRLPVDTLVGKAIRAKAAGGAELAGFKTEAMCMRVHLLDPAIDPDRWDACGTDEPISLADHRNRTALCLDVSLDGTHATLVAAAVVGGKVHVEVVRAWSGFGCTKAVRQDLPSIVRRVKPRVLGWFPAGPAAALAADLRARKGPATDRWPPRGVLLDELKAELPSICMGLGDIVTAGDLEHPNDELLTVNARAAQKLRRGDGFVFTRKGKVPIDGSYALAGAVHLARTLPPPPPPLTVA
jgi:hypothetical protein